MRPTRPARPHYRASRPHSAGWLACTWLWRLKPAWESRAGLTHRRETVAHLIADGFDTIEAAVASQAASPGEAVAAAKWLALARSAAPAVHELLDQASQLVLDLQPCLRDARADHFLFEQERLTGIIDFGAMDVDCVAGDLAQLIGEWAGGDPAARVTAREAYDRIRPLKPAEIPLVSVFETIGRSLDRRALAPLALPRAPPLRRPASRLQGPRPRTAKRSRRLKSMPSNQSCS